MSYEVSGKLIEKFDTFKVSDNFQKREFVVEISDNRNGTVYTDFIKFQLVKDKCGILDDLNLNEDIKVNFNIRGRRYEKEGRMNYFTNLEAWRIDKLIPLDSNN